MPRLNSEEVKKRRQKSARREYIQDVISKKCTETDPIQLSDLIVNAGNWGGSALVVLGGNHRESIGDGETPMMWKIRVVRDEWGNKLTQGDKVYRRTQKSLKDREDQLLSPAEMSRALQDGSYDERFLKVKEFKVDKKGCITCNFEDAVHFLNIWGMHSETGRALTTKKELSREPVDAPNGQKLHCHYWRYREMTEEQYKALPELAKRKEPLRGIAPVETVTAFEEDNKLRKDIDTEKRKQKIKEEARKS